MRHFTRRLLAISPVVAAVLLLACSGDDNNGDSNGSSPSAMHVVMQDIAYDTTALTATRGQTARIDVENRGQITHDFTIERMPMRGLHMTGGADMEHMGSDSMYAVHLPVDKGTQATLEFEPTEAGTYEYFCTVPGHREAGMHGTLTVQ